MKNRTLLMTVAGYLAGLASAAIFAMLMPASTPRVDAPTDTAMPRGSGSVQPTTSAATAANLMSAAAGSPTSAQDVPQHSATPLSPEVRARVTPLEARLATNPGDFATRKQLAVILLQNQHMMPAYEHATQILATHPEDPDGLYVHAVVRLAMGHATKTLELLDRVLAQYPEHAMALKVRAEAQRKIGDETGAALSETKAREAALGNKSDVDQLLAAASSGTLIEMMRSTVSNLPPSGGTDVGLTDSGETGANGD